MEIFTQVDTWVALLTLTFLEIVLGIDNIIFISIATGKLPKHQQKKATNIGLLLAMVFRVILLLGVSYLIAMKDALITIETTWLDTHVSGQSIILFLGGLFLLYKSTSEIRHKVEGHETGDNTEHKPTSTMSKTILQIVLIDIVFSFDSVLTAVGMTNGTNGALYIMITSVIVSMAIMMLFANPVGKFVNANPTIQMLALSFLILIGFMLITEGAHLAHMKIFDQEIGAIPKGYLYFAIAFSLGIEALNMKIRKKKI